MFQYIICLSFDFKQLIINYTWLKHSHNTKSEVNCSLSNLEEISLDIRKRIVDAYKAGDGYQKLAKQFNVSKNRARSFVKKFEATKKLTNKIGRSQTRCWKEN